MKYTMYYEERSTITREKFELIKKGIQDENIHSKLESYTLRKLQFIGMSSLGTQPNYYLCIKNSDDSLICLEKKYVLDGIHYKESTPLTRKECQKILDGDIAWLENHKIELLADFHRQVTLNYLRPGYMTDYQRETIKGKKEGCVTFSKKINRAVGTQNCLFDQPDMWISCLNDNEIMVNYKKEITMPAMISSMLQNMEEQPEDMAFAF